MTEEQIQYLPLDRIECRPQVRESFDEESILGLARSIQETDRVLQPIRVRRDNGAFVVVDGERRVRAARKLGLPSVPVIIEDKELCAAEVLHRQLVLDCQKEHLTAVERAKAIQDLMHESGWSATQVAQRIGISPANVTRLLSVLKLPAEAQEQVAAGTLGTSTAYAICRTSDPDTKEALLNDVANGHVTREHVAERSRSRRSKRGKTRRRSKAHAACLVLPFGDGCSLNVVGQGVTVTLLTNWLTDLVNRIAAIEPRDMPLTDAVARLVAERE